MTQPAAPLQGIAGIEPPGAYDAVHSRPLLLFGDLVSELGGDPVPLLHQAGIAPPVVHGAGPAVTYRQIVDLFERAAGLLSCPDFGMRLALRQGTSVLFGPLGAAMRSAATLGEAQACAVTHSHAHSLAAGIWASRDPQRREIRLGHNILIEGPAVKAQAIEWCLLAGVLVIAELTGGRVRPLRVNLRHRAVAQPAAYRRHFGCEVRFERSADAIVLAEDSFACPLPTRDTQRHRSAIAELDRRFGDRSAPLHARVRGMLSHFIPQGRCGKEDVAAELGLHPRTLQRRLAEEGTSFQRIKDAVRRDTLAYYLRETDLDLTDISQVLGFSEQAVLTRFSHKWFGQPPSQLRQQANGHRPIHSSEPPSATNSHPVE